MSSDSWPPQLKEWVAKCLGQMTDTNRTEAQAELRQVIADAFGSQSLWTTDWAGVQLQRFLSRIHDILKRKTKRYSPSSKKAKKALKQASSNSTILDINDQAALNRRAERFQREHEIEKTKSMRNGGQDSIKANYQNAHLFNRSNNRSASPSTNSDDPNADPAPKPEQIRPYPVLQQTLLELKKRWRESPPIIGLRQDLTVQRIKNDFTVQVYEIHARMALESGDMVEYNQCQATLKTLYELGIPGKDQEFTAYRILMLLHGRNRSELNIFVGQLTPRHKADPAVRHALAVQRALSMGNYHSLFELYANAPIWGQRVKALMVMAKAYKTIPLSFLQSELTFDTLDATRTFLVDHSAAFFTNPFSPDNQKIFDCKPAGPKLTQVLEDKYRKVLIKGAI
ncbi:SAC3/GANP/Nin1/mts3/eIF-3 p25 family-domain-containing protein [Infundibulicybe gibba]|nr:SAC3/GANP/Nin1/mts3/eIF-3 p25 family-domain-containing protein [Infundibulicybe gibba]